MPRVALSEARRIQRLGDKTLRAWEASVTGEDGKMRVTRDDLLAVARLMHEVDRAWMRDRTAQGRPVYNKSTPRDRTPAGRAQRAAQRKAALQAQPGAIAPIGPSAPAPVACMPDPGCSAPTPMPTPSTQSDATTPAPSDDAKESLSSA